MKNKKKVNREYKTLIFIRFIIAVLFLVTLVVIWFFKSSLDISQKFIDYFGSFVIALYSIIYGIENVMKKKYNFGIFLIAFALIIIMLNFYMIKNVEGLLFN